MNRKKLIFVTHILPYPFDMGSKIRAFNLLKCFSKVFDVTLACQVVRKEDMQHVGRFKEVCNEVLVTLAENRSNVFYRVFHRGRYAVMHAVRKTPADLYYANDCGLGKTVRRLFNSCTYDVSFFMYWFWPDLVRSAPGLKVVDTNDIQHLRMEQMQGVQGRRPLLGSELESYRRREMATLEEFDVLVTVTGKDRRYLEENNIAKNVLTVPTGVDTEYFSRADGRSQKGNVISFYGAMSGKTNVDALFFFYHDVFPIIRRAIPDVRLLVIGSHPTPAVQELGVQDSAVTVTGFVDDVRGVLLESAVSVCPMRVGYGIRGRVLEIMSLGIPVVCTEVAIDGMGLKEGSGILVRNDPSAIAEGVVELLQNKQEASAVGDRGRRWIEKHFSYRATYGWLAEYLHEACVKTDHAPEEG